MSLSVKLSRGYFLFINFPKQIQIQNDLGSRVSITSITIRYISLDNYDKWHAMKLFLCDL